FKWVPPPLNYYQAEEWFRLGGLKRDWVRIEDMSPHLPRAAVAAEDANFCQHWGVDVEAVRDALAGGARRGGSTISQQTAKNVFLWQERSWVRKGLELGFTGLIEGVWGKERILEIYLNVAEFDEGVFGVGAAMPHYFGRRAEDATLAQSAALMAVLPNPKARSAIRPTQTLRKRARQIASGAGTVAADGRARCFEH
ncbi:MAG: monofunctional biosynthetic peptidoglycan transglycosylase, partial [Pseudomonadota bacterium]